jgi:imidazolonepropionase-like amidohydrolase
VRGPRIIQAIHVTPAGGTYAPRQTLKARLLFSAMGLPTIEYGARQSGVVTFAPDASAQEVRDAVDRAIDERGAEVIKLCDQPEHFLDYKPGAAVPTGEQMAAAADQARRRGLPSTMHNVTLAGFRHGIEAGLNSLAHLPMDGTLTEADALRLLRSVTFIEPTVKVGYYMSYSMKGSPFAGHPEIARLDTLRDATMAERVAESWLPALQESKLGYHRLLKSGEMKLYGFLDLSEPYRFYSRLIPVGGQNLRLLVQQGAGKRLGCGSDAGPVACSPSVIYQELSMLDFVLNRDGHRLFTPADVLRVATIQSAHALGKDEQYGSIAPGKVADLALLDGDPLQDLSLIGKPVQALFMGGKLVINRCGLVVAPC